jgi:hypothetical protein
MLFYKDHRQDLYSSIIETEYKEYFPDIIITYFTQDRQEQKRISGIP